MAWIPIFPLDVVAYPGASIPLHIFEERYCLMTEEALVEGTPIGIALARQDQPEGLVEYDPEEVGTSVRIVAAERLQDGRYLLECRGERRFRVEAVRSVKPYQEAEVTWLDEPAGSDAPAAVDPVVAELERLGVEEVLDEVDARDPVAVSYAVASALEAPLLLKQKLLAAGTAAERLRMERTILHRIAPAP